jgi:hypothetical protein
MTGNPSSCLAARPGAIPARQGIHISEHFRVRKDRVVTLPWPSWRSPGMVQPAVLSSRSTPTASSSAATSGLAVPTTFCRGLLAE